MTDDGKRGNDPPASPDRANRADRVAATDAIERALERLPPPGARISALAVRQADGAVVAAADPDRVVPPASNTKLIAAALALDRLGPDHRFETALATRGRVDDGVLDGDLVLRGTGAPDVTVDALADLAEAAAGVLDRVEGDLIADVTEFAGPQRGPGRVWSDERHDYGARSSALALAGNVVEITVTGADESVSVAPDTDCVDVAVDVTIAPDDHRSDDDGADLSARHDRGTGRIHVAGTVPPGETGTITVPVATPVRHCGLAARDALSGVGVEVAGDVSIVHEGPVETDERLGVVSSAPVGELVGALNVDSDNFVAEQLARATAAAVAGEGSWDAWADLVADHLGDLGVETVGVRDGSGLSRYNRLPARAIVALLEWAGGRSWAGAFFDSLPGPGEGTLADRLSRVPVVAKTGTLTGTRALSGRVGEGDDAILFSCLVGGITTDDVDVRGRQDEFVRALAAAGEDDE